MTMTKQKPEYIPHAWEEPPCPVCGDEDHSVVERYGNRKQYTNVLCAGCGLLYGRPRPTHDEHFLKAAYSDYHLLRDDHKYADRHIENFRGEVGELLTFDSKRSAMLDVGCAMGDFLYAAKDAYTTLCGVEVSSKMAEYTRKNLGVTVFEERYEDLSTVTSQRFSCIHLSHVIEHIPNPNEWIGAAAKLLEDDGLLIVCVPHGNSLTRIFKRWLSRIGVRKGKWGPEKTPDHLFLPTIKSMRVLFERNGFNIENLYTYSRKDMLSESFASRLLNRHLHVGTNLRFYLRKVS
jgi:2-polyprenyl-3-methyl-5-hydroxy-6-metoxy-1,4-benzoquinol methylase